MSGAIMMAMRLGASAMAFGGGYIITGFGYRNLFLIGFVLTIAAKILFGAYFRLPRGEYASPGKNTQGGNNS